MRQRNSLIALLAIGICAGAFAQNANSLNQRSLAATCANCHGTEGRTVEGSAVPPLAGIPKEYMIQQMKSFKDGTRQATVMHQLAKGYSDQQIESIANYFSALKR